MRPAAARARLNLAGDKYAGSGDFTYYDPSGAVVVGGTFTITAQRVDLALEIRG